MQAGRKIALSLWRIIAMIAIEILILVGCMCGLLNGANEMQLILLRISGAFASECLTPWIERAQRAGTRSPLNAVLMLSLHNSSPNAPRAKPSWV